VIFSYRTLLTPDDNGTLLATCPALPEVTTFGETEDEAYRRLRDAIEEAVAGRIAANLDVPNPDIGEMETDEKTVSLSLQAAAKAALYRMMRSKGVSRADLQRRLGWHREQVDRLFRLDHASRMDQIGAAFEALGQNVGLDVQSAERAA
jgi:antitoxin HicB